MINYSIAFNEKLQYSIQEQFQLILTECQIVSCANFLGCTHTLAHFNFRPHAHRTFLPFYGVNSIEIGLWTCNLLTNQSVSYKSVLIEFGFGPFIWQKKSTSDVKIFHICNLIPFHISTFHIVEETPSGQQAHNQKKQPIHT